MLLLVNKLKNCKGYGFIENKRWIGLLLVISGGIFWGASGSVAELMFNTHNVSPLWIVGVRLLSAGILLLISYIMINRASIFSIWKNQRFRKQLLMFSIFGMMPSQLLYFLAIKFGNASTATVLQFTSPVFIVLYLAIKTRHLPSRLSSLSVLIAVVGTFLLATRGQIDALSISLLGLIFGLGSGLANAIYTLIPVELLKNYDAKLVCGWGMLIGSIPLLPIVATTAQPTYDANFIMEVLFIIIIGTMLAYLFYVASLNYLNPSVTSVLGSFEPLTATFLSVAFLNLKLNFTEVIGIALILFMAVLQSLPQKNKQ